MRNTESNSQANMHLLVTISYTYVHTIDVHRTFVCSSGVEVVHPRVHDMHESILPRLHTMPLLGQLTHKTHSELAFLRLRQVYHCAMEDEYLQIIHANVCMYVCMYVCML